MKRLWLVALLVLAAPPALAGNFYIGLNAGQGTLKDTEVANRIDLDAVGGKVYAGWNFSRYVSIEGGYTNFGDPSETENSVETEASLDGVFTYGKATLPLLPIFEIWAMAGATSWNGELTSGGVRVADDSGIDFTWGLGLGFNIGQRLKVRLESEAFKTSFADETRLTSVGIQFNF